jgi:hypothetical protein
MWGDSRPSLPPGLRPLQGRGRLGGGGRLAPVPHLACPSRHLPREGGRRGRGGGESRQVVLTDQAAGDQPYCGNPGCTNQCWVHWWCQGAAPQRGGLLSVVVSSELRGRRVEGYTLTDSPNICLHIFSYLSICGLDLEIYKRDTLTRFCRGTF